MNEKRSLLLTALDKFDTSASHEDLSDKILCIVKSADELTQNNKVHAVLLQQLEKIHSYDSSKAQDLRIRLNKTIRATTILLLNSAHSERIEVKIIQLTKDTVKLMRSMEPQHNGRIV